MSLRHQLSFVHLIDLTSPLRLSLSFPLCSFQSHYQINEKQCFREKMLLIMNKDPLGCHYTCVCQSYGLKDIRAVQLQTFEFFRSEWVSVGRYSIRYSTEVNILFLKVGSCIFVSIFDRIDSSVSLLQL